MRTWAKPTLLVRPHNHRCCTHLHTLQIPSPGPIFSKSRHHLPPPPPLVAATLLGTTAAATTAATAATAATKGVLLVVPRTVSAALQVLLLLALPTPPVASRRWPLRLVHCIARLTLRPHEGEREREKRREKEHTHLKVSSPGNDRIVSYRHPVSHTNSATS
mgnify:CR=1 FL=1